MALSKKTISWKEHHDSLNDAKKTEARGFIMKTCEWSYSTFYRKMENPQSLKFYEKTIVAQAYGKTVTALFPERVTKTKAA